MSLRFSREPKGYGMLGLSWAFSSFGRTLMICCGRSHVRLHWNNQKELALLHKRVEELERDTGAGAP